MSDLKKTKKQLVAELTQLRQRVVEQSVAGVQQPPPPETTLERIERRKSDVLIQAGLALNNSLNYEAILDCLLAYVGEMVSHDAASLLLIEDETVRVSRWYGYNEFETGVSLTGLTFDRQTFAAQGGLPRGQEPLLIPVMGRDDIWARELSAPWIKSRLSLPIFVQRELIGLLNVDCATPKNFAPTDVKRLQTLVHQASLAFKNAQLYDQAREEIANRVAALKLERNFVSTVLDSAAGALVMVLDLEGRIHRFNRACQETTGYTLAEVQNQYFWDMLLVREERIRVKRIFETLRTGKLPDPYQTHWVSKDNRRRLIAWTSTFLPDSNGQVEYIVNTGNDITEQQQLEERLLALHHLGRELNLLRDEESIWEIALETAAFLLEFKSAGYGIVTDPSDALHYLYQPIRGIPTTINLQLPFDTNQRLALLQAHGVQLDDALEEVPPPPDANLEAWLSAPMKLGERLIGVLDIESSEPHPFTTNDQRLLQTLADQTAVAIENARLHQEARHRVDELTTMNMVGQAITSTLNLEETLTIITDHSIRLLGATAAAVVLNDEIKGNLWFHAASGGSSDFVRGKRLPSGQGIVGWVIDHSEAVLVPDVAHDERFFSKFDQQTGFTTQSVICAPLRTGNQTIGAIEVLNKKVGVFTPEDLQLVNWLATPAATAIENARLFEAEHAARKQAEILRVATSTLASTLDLERVLNTILDHLEDVVPFDHAYVFLHEQDWLQVVAERGAGQPTNGRAKRRYPPDNALYQKIGETGQPVILADAQNDARFEIWENVDTIRGWMGVPLIVQRLVIGCLTLESQQVGAYGQVEAALAQAFANQAAVAIQNARLFEQVQISSERLQSLSRRLVEIQETERRRIARELHDEAGQSLSGLLVRLRLLESKVDDPAAVLEGITELKQMSNDISEGLHRLATDLRPASLDHLGLETTLRKHIETFGHQNNLVTQFEAVGLAEDKRLLPTVETNLYRVVQEALTNVLRHAQATQVDVLLERRGDQVVAIIEDNGVGFDAEKAGKSSRLGLLGMRERAEMLDGELNIESSPGAGTTIYVEVPYVHSNSDS